MLGHDKEVKFKLFAKPVPYPLYADLKILSYRKVLRVYCLHIELMRDVLHRK